MRERGIVERQRVRLHDARACEIRARRKNGDETLVDLDCGDVDARFEERRGERTGSGADLEDARRPLRGKSGDALRGVEVDEEVLSEPFARTDRVRADYFNV